MEKFKNEKNSEKEKYVDFGEQILDRLGMQSQYAARYLFGVLGSENLGQDLKIEGSYDDYHFIKIHPADLEIFIQRLIDLKKSKGIDLTDNQVTN